MRSLHLLLSCTVIEQFKGELHPYSKLNMGTISKLLFLVISWYLLFRQSLRRKCTPNQNVLYHLKHFLIKNVIILRHFVWETQKSHHNFSRSSGSWVNDKQYLHVLITVWPYCNAIFWVSKTICFSWLGYCKCAKHAQFSLCGVDPLEGFTSPFEFP